MQNKKFEILDYCIDKSIDFSIENLHFLSSNSISDFLKISRSLASQYLNDLTREKELIKIITRPVYFIHKRTLENQYQIEFKDNILYSIDELIEYLESSNVVKRNIESLIGYDHSLISPIEQIKASFKYPKNIIPILIKGKSGVGKTLICKKVFEYCKENGIFSEEARFEIIHFTADEDLWTSFIEALYRCHDGVVFLERVQDMPNQFRQNLISLLKDKKYTKNKIQYEINTHIVAAYTEEDGNSISEDLLQCFPVVCEIPSFNQRSYYEREAFIFYLFKKQSIQMHKRIFLSQSLISILANRDYKNNIDELDNIILQICANANNRCGGKENIHINISNLPDQMLSTLSIEGISIDNDNYSIDVSSYKRQDEESMFIELITDIIGFYLRDNEDNKGDFLTKGIKRIQHYYSNNVSKKNINVELVIKTVSNQVISNYNYIIPTICYSFLADYIFFSQMQSKNFKEWENSRKTLSLQLYKRLGDEHPSAMLLTEKIAFELQRYFDIKVHEICKIVLLMNIMHYNDSLIKSKYLSIIIAHGQSTASSMASAVNELLGTYVFEAFDMPLNTTMLDIVSKLNDFINQYMVKSNVLLLVDMGSLETITEHLKIISNKSIGVINNVSTKMALDVGFKILQNKDIKSILEDVSKEAVVKYTLMENSNKSDAILFVSENGITMANKIKQIFVQSLPKTIDVEILTIEFEKFLDDEYANSLKKEYNILFSSGTCSENMKIKEFIPIEDIITRRNINTINKKLSKYLDIEEMEKFNNKLIYNFSLENIVDSITILDAKRLLGFVEDAVTKMQNMLGYKLDGSTLVGLYMHLCCMIERLVIKEPIKTQKDIESFKLSEKQFISIVKKCFEKTCHHYGIEISIQEISYLYEYIEADKYKEKRGE